MNNIDKQYQALLQDILDNGVQKKDRTGTGTLSVFGRQIRHKMSEGFPLLTTKKMHWKSIVVELLWFLRGDTNIKYLVDNDCHIWVGDAWTNYSKKVIANNLQLIPAVDLPKNKEEFIDKIKTDEQFAKEWGNLGPIYGKQWRSWIGKVTGLVDSNFIYHGTQVDEIDQISNAIQQLKTNPDDRGIIVSAWNVGELQDMVLRPCHNFFQFYTRELSFEERIRYANSLPLRDRNKNPVILAGVPEETFQLDEVFNVPKRAISLMWNQRSCDMPLGIPMNIASYALLLLMIAKEVNMIPEDLIGNLGDVHIYKNQIEGVKEQLQREPYELPNVILTDRIISDISEYNIEDIVLQNYKFHPKIHFPLSN